MLIPINEDGFNPSGMESPYLCMAINRAEAKEFFKDIGFHTDQEYLPSIYPTIIVAFLDDSDMWQTFNWDPMGIKDILDNGNLRIKVYGVT